MKAAELVKTWTKATTTLDTGIKKSLGKDVDPKEVKDLQSTYKEWQGLLGQAQKKANKWDEDDEKEQDKFKTFLKSQLVNERRFENDLKKLDQQLSDESDTEKRLKVALQHANNYYRIEVKEKLDEAQEAITETQFALVRELPKAIDFQFQRACKILTNEFMDSLAPAGIEKELKQIAAKHKVALRDLEADKRLEAFTVGQAKKVRELDKVVDGLRERCKAFEQELKEKTAESTNKNASPEYKANLNKLLKAYKEANGALKKSFSELEDAGGELEKLRSFIARADADAVAEAAGKAVGSIETILSGLSKFEKQLEGTFGDAPMGKKLQKYTITPEDTKKFFDPVVAKAGELGNKSQALRLDTKKETASIGKVLQNRGTQGQSDSDAESIKKSIRALSRLATG